MPLCARNDSCRSSRAHSYATLVATLVVVRSPSSHPCWTRDQTQADAIGSHPCKAVACCRSSAQRIDMALRWYGGKAALGRAFANGPCRRLQMERKTYASRRTDWRLSRRKTQPEATSRWRMRCGGIDGVSRWELTTGYRHLARSCGMVVAPAFRSIRRRNKCCQAAFAMPGKTVGSEGRGYGA